MYLTYVRHRVKDFAHWRSVFDEHTPILKEAGAIDTRIVQVDGDPHDIVVITTWPSSKNWETFIALHGFTGISDIKAAQDKAGIIGTPEFLGGEVE